MTATRTTPCRSWPATPANRRHVCSAEHAALVRDYRDARLAYEAQRDAETNEYATERRMYAATHTPMTFKRYLQGMRDDTRPEEL